LHAENIFVGFVVPENKIFYAALLFRLVCVERKLNTQKQNLVL
jgi:hypothetical protein